MTNPADHSASDGATMRQGTETLDELLLRVEEAERPIPMVLFCPSCGLQHIDEPDERTPEWTNPPHRSHLCHGCGHIWRPASRATEGVRRIDSCGKADSPIPEVSALQASEARVKVLERALRPFVSPNGYTNDDVIAARSALSTHGGGDLELVPEPSRLGEEARQSEAEPSAAELSRAAWAWRNDKDRETDSSDQAYFLNNWRSLPGLRQYVTAQIELGRPLAEAIAKAVKP